MNQEEKSDSRSPNDFRHEAERRLDNENATPEEGAEVGARSVHHELQVHQIELEMQNEELLRAQSAVQEVSEKYQDLFDFAPIGYFRLDEQDRILEVNLAGAALLGLDPRTAVTQRLGQYIALQDHARFAQFRKDVLVAESKQTCEIELRKNEKSVYVVLEGVAAPDHRFLRVAAIDITERKRAEQALHETERRFRLALQCSGAGIWDWEIETGRMDWSPELFHLFGLDPAHTEASFETWRTVLHPDDRQTAEERIAAAVRDRVQLKNEYRIVCPTGEERWILSIGETTYDASGQPWRMIGLCLDITARKRAEEARHQRAEAALRLSEQEFRFLAEAMPQIAWATRPDGWNIYFNQQWVDYTGMTMEESYGHGWNTPFHPDDKLRAWEAWQRATQHNERYSLECRLRRADGVYRWWLIRGEPMRGANGEILKWFGTCTDIEEIKNAEAALQEANELLERRVVERTAALSESEERFRTMVNAMPQLAWIASHDGWIQWYNQRWYEYTGTTPEQMEGWGWQSVHDPDELPQVLERWKASIASGEAFEMTFPLRGADGIFRLFLTRGFPLKDAAGRVAQWFGTNTDVTELKRAEAAIKASLTEKEVMLREIHHRVKNNMQVICSLVSLQAESLADTALNSALADVRDRVRSMALVHEKLYQSDNLAKVDFAAYAESLLRPLWNAHAPHAAVRLKLALGPVTLTVDTAVPCGLILNELAVNALKHAFRGRSEGVVTVAMGTEPDGLVSLRVSDNGVGLPVGIDWQQAKSLGLRLVKMLAKQLRGKVEARTGSGGTEFEIVFPGGAE